jgi:hypothetical protein
VLILDDEVALDMRPRAVAHPEESVSGDPDVRAKPAEHQAGPGWSAPVLERSLTIQLGP